MQHFGKTGTAVFMEFSQLMAVALGSFARWQRPALGHGARFDMTVITRCEVMSVAFSEIDINQSMEA